MAKLKKRCKTFRCPNLHTNENGYCDECNERYRREHPREDQVEYEKHRPSASRRGYDNKWQKFRKDYLAEHPTCAICGKPAKVVDHKDLPADCMMDAYGGFDYDLSHYQALCYSCNARKGVREDREARQKYMKDKEFLAKHSETQGGGSKKLNVDSDRDRLGRSHTRSLENFLSAPEKEKE